MKTYLDPELNIVKFSSTDIILDSGTISSGNNNNENWDDYTYPIGPPPRG